MDLSSRETLTVPSIHNDKIRYCINYDHGFSPELYRLPSVTRFARWGSTLGDGNTMHTPWTPVPMRLLGDFCASTLHTLLTEWDAPSWRLMTAVWPQCRISTETKELFRKLRYSDEQREWYSAKLAKRSKNSEKEHDNRWSVVPSNADGSGKAFLSLIDHMEPTASHLELIVNAIETYDDHRQTDNDISERYGIKDGSYSYDPMFTLDAVRGLNKAIQGFYLMDQGNRCIECWRSNVQLANEMKTA